MPLGLGWLVDVRDYFVEAPFAICLVALALHLFYSKLGYCQLHLLKEVGACECSHEQNR